MFSLQLLRLFAQHIGSICSRIFLKFFDSFTIVLTNVSHFHAPLPNPRLFLIKHVFLTHLFPTLVGFLVCDPLSLTGTKGFPRMGTVYLWLHHWRNRPASHLQQPLTANSFGEGVGGGRRSLASTSPSMKKHRGAKTCAGVLLNYLKRTQICNLLLAPVNFLSLLSQLISMYPCWGVCP